MQVQDQTFFRNAAVLTAFSLVLSGCLSGGGSDDPDVPERDVPTNHTLSGSVGDGPIVGATVRVLSRGGAELAQLESDSNSNYNVTVSTDSDDYPLTVESLGGTDLVTNAAPDFDLLSAVGQGSQSIANVNPFSTFTVELARDLPGGISVSNLLSAQSTVVAEFNFGLSTLAASGVVTTRIDGGNIAEIVRASEALGETVRRMRGALGSNFFGYSANDIVHALSSDLTDRVVDGLGGARSDDRIAAVATVVSAQVLLETMANQLHVNGFEATQAMSNAIDQVSSGSVDPTLDDLTVTAGMLERARVGLVAAHAVTSDAAIAELLTALESVQVGASSSMVRTMLPADYRSRLDNAVVLVAGGSASVLDSVNDVSRARTTTIGGGNRAPTITGTPAASVEAGQAYLFTPAASDPDGDALSFGISNIPTWASFNTMTGELSGTPAGTDVGNYTNITITVSDGQLLSSLGPFSINVFSGNAAPSISGTPASSVEVGVPYFFAPDASDPNGDTLTFSIVNQPPWATFSTANGRLTGTPGVANIGVYSAIAITVSDGTLSDTLGPFSIEVTGSGVNTPPTISGTPDPEVMADNPYSFTPTAIDVDGDTLSFSVAGLPSWASFSTLTGELSGTPQEADVGTYSGITITVSDGIASADLGPFTITVQAIGMGSVTLNWTAPTLNDDGSTLIDLDGYWIYWGTTPGVYPNSERIDDESLTTYVIDNLLPGTYEFVATSFNTAGVESSYSITATKTVTAQ